MIDVLLLGPTASKMFIIKRSFLIGTSICWETKANAFGCSLEIQDITLILIDAFQLRV